jgi:hypothetical protein
VENQTKTQGKRLEIIDIDIALAGDVPDQALKA